MRRLPSQLARFVITSMKTLTSTRIFTRPISGKFAHRSGFCLPPRDVRDESRPGQKDQDQPLCGDIAGKTPIGLSYLDLSTAFFPPFALRGDVARGLVQEG